MSVTERSSVATVKIGHGQDALKYFLEKLPARESAEKTKTLVFHLVEKQSKLEEDLTELRKQVKTLKTRDSPKKEQMVNVGLQKQTKAMQAQPGMSFVNPTSKKRKAARGVQFD